jgi:hypothetical protein
VTLGKIISLAGVAAGVLVCAYPGPRSAGAFELQTKTDQGESYSTTSVSFKNNARDAAGWLSLKYGGTVRDMNPISAGPSDPLMMIDVPMLSYQSPLVRRTTIADTRATVGMWDDWVRLTTREAMSNYFKPSTNTPSIYAGNLLQTGPGLENVATSQHLDINIWKSGSTRVSMFGEYDRVGAGFQIPNPNQGKDLFSTPNSTATRMGGSVEQGPISLTLEQRTQQSIAQEDSPINVSNQIGVWLNFDELLRGKRWIPEEMSWLVPSSAYINLGQGRIKAAAYQGVNGDTTSDVSAGLSWSRDKIYVSLDYWRSGYQSQLYPWNGWGFDAVVGYHEEKWGVDLYFDANRSMSSYPWEGVLYTDRYTELSGGVVFRRHF